MNHTTSSRLGRTQSASYLLVAALATFLRSLERALRRQASSSRDPVTTDHRSPAQWPELSTWAAPITTDRESGHQPGHQSGGTAGRGTDDAGPAPARRRSVERGGYPVSSTSLDAPAPAVPPHLYAGPWERRVRTDGSRMCGVVPQNPLPRAVELLDAVRDGCRTTPDLVARFSLDRPQRDRLARAMATLVTAGYLADTGTVTRNGRTVHRWVWAYQGPEEYPGSLADSAPASSTVDDGVPTSSTADGPPAAPLVVTAAGHDAADALVPPHLCVGYWELGLLPDGTERRGHAPLRELPRAVELLDAVREGHGTSAALTGHFSLDSGQRQRLQPAMAALVAAGYLDDVCATRRHRWVWAYQGPEVYSGPLSQYAAPDDQG